MAKARRPFGSLQEAATTTTTTTAKRAGENGKRQLQKDEHH